MKKILFLVVLGVLGAVVYFQWQDQQEPVATVSPIGEVPAVPSAASSPRYPIPSLPPTSASVEVLAEPIQQESEVTIALAPASIMADPLPALNNSNAEMKELFSSLFGSDVVRSLFNLDEIIRRFVVTIDNLPNKKLPRKNLLVTRAAGAFQVVNEAGGMVIAPDNAARYAPFVSLATQVDAEQLVAIYVRFYALFQAAYAELSYPNAYFNDRLVDVIEHLLSTPVVDEPIQLVQPKIFYQYADAELEARSAGQKILLRMGSVSAEQIKTKLREIRRLLIEPSLLQKQLGQDASPEVKPSVAE